MSYDNLINKCDPCNKTFTCKDSLKRHYKSQCHINEITKSDNGNINIKISYDNLIHKCDPCNKTFVSNDSLKRHYKSQGHKNKVNDNIIDLTYDCEICDKKFVDKDTLNCHNRSESHKRKFNNFQLKKTQMDQILSIDHDEEIDEINLKCKICDKVFSVKNSLKRHLETKLHKINLENYIMLKNISTEDKDKILVEQFNDEYKCQVCNISCGESSSLKKHYETQYHKKNFDELNDPNIICTVPTKKKNVIVALSLKDEEGNFILKCDICDETYTNVFGMKHHIDTDLHKTNLEKKNLLEKAILSDDEFFFISLKNKNGEIIGNTMVDRNVYINIIKHPIWMDDGYAIISVDSKPYRLNRYIYYNLQEKENDPDKKIDHANNDKLDNRLINLREADDSQNARNKLKLIGATSNYHGVSSDKDKWVCSQIYQGKNYSFRYENESHAAYHHDLLIKKFNLQDFNKLNDIEMPEGFILKEPFKKTHDLPKGIYLQGNRGKFCFSFLRKQFYGFNSLEEASICRFNKIQEQIIIKQKEILAEPILRNEAGIAIINILYKNKELFVTTLVDDDIYYKLKSCPINYNGEYATITFNKKTDLLSRFIMNYNGKKCVDHADSNKLNNQKYNLRILNSRGNGQNKSSVKGSSSEYVGVSYRKERNKWEASIKMDGKNIYSKIFDTENEAVIARDRKALEVNKLGNFYKINL